MNDSGRKKPEDFEVVIYNNETSQQYSLGSELSLSFLGINITLLVPMIYFCRLIMLMAKRESKTKKDMLLGSALMCFAVLLPVLVFVVPVANLFGVLSLIYPAAEILGAWYCHLLELVAYFTAIYMGIFSLLSAVLRYRYIVGNEKGEIIDKDKAKKTLLIFHLTIPAVVALLHSISNGEKDQLLWVNKCWGHKETKTPHEENDFIYYIGDVFCYDRKYEIEHYVGTTAANVFEPVLRVICGGLTVFYMVFLSNVIELILYFIIFTNMNR